MTTTVTETTAEKDLINSLRIEGVQTVQFNESVENFNADVIAHGDARDKLEADCEAVIDAAETLKFADFQKQLKAVAASRLKLLQERVKLSIRGKELLQELQSEMERNIEKRREDLAAAQEAAGDALRTAGKGPEDSQAWAKGSTNQAQREFEKDIESFHPVINARKAVRVALERRELLKRHLHEWRSGTETKDELRAFVATTAERLIS